ncbi:MAG: 4Fe-4S binding protein [Rhodospirillales bacterium]|nr:4Fe-4S binding protein [Rhodospirillales bacterium]MBO6787343.1 4Fe-4S binding protein [Rhodospirillales bacterium]
MKLNGKDVFVCSCEDTMSIDADALAKALGGDGQMRPARHLCRVELDRFTDEAGKADEILVACTQEAPLFLDALEELGESAPEAGFLNIRELAGWSDAGRNGEKNVTAKMAALIKEASLELKDASSVSMISTGIVLVLGASDEAVEAARKLSERMDVTLVLEGGAEASPPDVMDMPIFSGRITSAKGHLGAFEITVENFRPTVPSSKDKLEFTGVGETGSSTCDLILDMRGKDPLFSAADKRDGYFHIDPNSPAAVMEALFTMTDMIGEFEKPRYVDYDPGICAHSRSRITGCSKCLDICPTGAIEPNGDTVKYDPYICAGCGLCAVVCPTGAAKYNLPAGDGVSDRLRALIGTYTKAGGTQPRLLIHDGTFGRDVISLSARHGRGLPGNVIPFAVNQVTQVGLETVTQALALGCSEICYLLPPKKREDRDTLLATFELVDAITDGLGYGKDRVRLIEPDDPDQLEAALYDHETADAIPAGDVVGAGRKRSVLRLSLDALHKKAPNKVDEIALPAGAPFGTVNIDTAGCTLCLACVGACPTGALRDNENMPQLSFVEDACVQCGLCKNTCPEKVISLQPRLSFRDEAKTAHVVKEEQPCLCIRCGKPFATRASLDHLESKLKGHVMFQGEGKLDRLRMCEDCRVVEMTTHDDNPLAHGTVPIPRTTDDYLRERDEMREKAKEDMIKKGLTEGEA